jgi:hypothetical protein
LLAIWLQAKILVKQNRFTNAWRQTIVLKRVRAEGYHFYSSRTLMLVYKPRFGLSLPKSER